MTNSRFKVAALSLALSTIALITVVGANVRAASDAKKPIITVYKDPNCGCCKKWIEHLQSHGYRVDAKDTPDMTEIKRSLGVPDGLTACHTAVVNGYVIEGHVPAEDIDRLLKQKPTIAGVAVPGMPMGSPGMDGGRVERYQVMAFDKKGKRTVFASH